MLLFKKLLLMTFGTTLVICSFITLVPSLHLFSRLFFPFFFPYAHYAKVRKMSIINFLIANKSKDGGKNLWRRKSKR